MQGHRSAPSPRVPCERREAGVSPPKAGPRALSGGRLRSAAGTLARAGLSGATGASKLQPQPGSRPSGEN